MENESDGIRWVRFERWKRWHAVYTTAWGLHWTYCARSIRPSAVIEESAAPPAVCSCCRSRVARPYLVPEAVAALKASPAPPGLP